MLTYSPCDRRRRGQGAGEISDTSHPMHMGPEEQQVELLRVEIVVRKTRRQPGDFVDKVSSIGVA